MVKQQRQININVSNNKNLEVAFSSIYGIGKKEAISICKQLGLNSRMPFKKLNNQFLDVIASYIEFNYISGFHLKRLKKQHIDRLIKIKCYRGNRHFLGYLVRGQRSKNKKLRRHF